MRVLVTWGSKLGGTEEIARAIGEVLEANGLDVVAQPASHVPNAEGYDAAIVGGALYANRWHRDAYRFVTRNIAGLQRIPVWLFSSGPLDDAAERSTIPPPRQVSVLMERIGARGYATFGGRLAADAKGFPAAALARSHSGDWRNPNRIRAWAAQLAHDLPNAGPGAPSDPSARSVWRLLAHGAAGWALCAALMASLLQATSLGTAIAIHAVAAPLIFAAIALNYFRAHGAREPLPTALAFTGIVALLDAGVVALLILQSFAMFASVAGTWLPFGLIFLVTWAIGVTMSMMPEAKSDGAASGTAAISGHTS